MKALDNCSQEQCTCMYVSVRAECIQYIVPPTRWWTFLKDVFAPFAKYPYNHYLVHGIANHCMKALDS